MSIPGTLSISALRKAYRDGTTTPRERIGALVKRIRSSDNPAVWIHALDAAAVEPFLRRLEEVDPDSLPLYGIPFAIKDNIDLAGVPTTAGCAGYAYVPEKSAFVVEKLIQAGAVPLGKTNLDQFATGLVGVRSPYGVPRNPLAAGKLLIIQEERRTKASAVG